MTCTYNLSPYGVWLGSINVFLFWHVLASDCDWLPLFAVGLVIMVNLLPQALKQLTLIFFMQKVSSQNMVLDQMTKSHLWGEHWSSCVWPGLYFSAPLTCILYVMMIIWFLYLWLDPCHVKRVISHPSPCLIVLHPSGGFSSCIDVDYDLDFYSSGLNVLMLGSKQLSYKQRKLSASHQTNIVDWLGPPHSFTVWHGPRLECVWWWWWWGLTGNWPRMGRAEKAKHYVIVFLCFKRLPFMW